ncbi:hypothetical protein BsWGS_12029 [Bradybaena similaris]
MTSFSGFGMPSNPQYAGFSAFYDKNGEQLTEAQFKIQAMNKYMDLFQELRKRSARAAKMHYSIAADYGKMPFQLEFAFAAGAAALGAEYIPQTGRFPFKHTFGIAAFVFVVALLVIEFLHIASRKIIIIFSDKPQVHIEVAAGWQTLELKIRSIMIQLTDPKSNIKEYSKWLSEIIDERQKLCLVQIPHGVYERTAFS